MELLSEYQYLLTENKKLSLSGESYSGYLASADRESMRKVFNNLTTKLKTYAHQLSENSTYVAQNSSIESIKLLNTLVDSIKKIDEDFQSEMDRDLYKLPEIPLKGALQLLKEDNRAIKAIAEFRIACEDIIETKSFDEETLRSLDAKLSRVSNAEDQRQSTIEEVVLTYRRLNKMIQDTGKLIDKREVENLIDAVHAILTDAEGMTKPQSDLIYQFKERQIFIYRRAERAIERDNESLIFFDAYVELLEKVKAYLEVNSDTLIYGKAYQKLQQAVEGLPRIRERRDNLYHISGTKDHDVEAKQPEEEIVNSRNGKKKSGKSFVLISAASFTVLLITLVVIFIL